MVPQCRWCPRFPITQIKMKSEKCEVIYNADTKVVTMIYIRNKKRHNVKKGICDIFNTYLTAHYTHNTSDRIVTQQMNRLYVLFPSLKNYDFEMRVAYVDWAIKETIGLVC